MDQVKKRDRLKKISIVHAYDGKQPSESDFFGPGVVTCSTVFVETKNYELVFCIIFIYPYDKRA